MVIIEERSKNDSRKITSKKKKKTRDSWFNENVVRKAEIDKWHGNNYFRQDRPSTSTITANKKGTI